MLSYNWLQISYSRNSGYKCLTFYNSKNNEAKSPINGKTFSKHSFFSNQINSENLPMVKSVDIKPLFKTAKYQMKNCKTKYYHLNIPGKMLSHNWSKKTT